LVNIAICDDSIDAIESLNEEISKYRSSRSVKAAVKEAASGKELLNLATIDKFDIVFLDIDMPEQNGFEVAARLNSIAPYASIVFVTYMQNLVFKSFEFTPSGFLVKPVNQEIFAKTLDRIINKIEERSMSKTVSVKLKGGGEMKVRCSDIMYIESIKHYKKIQARDKSFECCATISDCMLLSEGFAQIHRSFLINLNYIWIVDAHGITLVNGVTLPIGRRFARSFIQRYADFNRTAGCDGFL
jgi:DNA-binding LytR/AlgR family response regulator